LSDLGLASELGVTLAFVKVHVQGFVLVISKQLAFILLNLVE